jgi:hypothetical protein
MGGNRNLLFVVIALAVVGVILAILYRSASDDELPDDEWLDFEHPS